jgi:AraC family transcriptional regulator
VRSIENTIVFPNIHHTLQITGCHIGRYPPGWEYPRHHHHLFELLCCLDGEVNQEINRTSLTLRSGDWLLINAGERHKTINASQWDYQFFNVHFDLDDMDIRSLLSMAPFHLVPASEAAGTCKLSRYIEELRVLMRPDPCEEEADAGIMLDDKLLLQANVLLIIRELLALIRRQGVKGKGAGAVSLFTAETAHAVEEKLSHSLSEEVSIAGIAKELNMSRSQCTKLFSKVYGLSPRQYVSRQKLMLAKEMLVTSHLQISEIAEQLGFQSASHFSRQFRRWTGQSPSQFKPKHRRDAPQTQDPNAT